MPKTDLKSAFRLIPIHPDNWDLLGIHWNNQYYVDLYLPFGLRSAPFLFNQFTDALEWVLKHNYGLKHVLHILDDFFIAEPTRLKCLSSFSTLLCFFMDDFFIAEPTRLKCLSSFSTLLCFFMSVHAPMVYFASYLPRTVKHSTIKLYLAAVCNLHISCQHGDPLSGKLLLKKILRGILCYQRQSCILCQPVTPVVLQTIKAILYSWLGDHDFTMVWTAFTLTFFAFLRCSEFTYQGISRFCPQVDLSTDCVIPSQSGFPAADVYFS